VVDSDPEQSQQQVDQIQDEQKSHPDAVHFTVDGEPLEIETNRLTMSEILALVGKKPDQWYLVEEIGGEQREFRDPDEEITITDHAVFLAEPAKQKYFVDIEGTDYDWHEATITAAQIRGLAGWGSEEQVIEVDLDDGTERTLSEDDVVELKPGRGFAKKIRFKRGS